MNDIKVVARRLKSERKKKHLSQEELGDLVWCSNATISMMERGDRRLSIDLAVQLADVFGCSVAWLLDLEEA